MSDCGCSVEIKDQSQKQILYWLLANNGLMFVIELAVGLIADSTALIADSIDMLADAIVYLIGLYAVGRAVQKKARAAQISGYFQAILGCLILVDILRRIVVGSEPVSLLMMSMGSVALVANVTCLFLIQKHKEGDVHMRASWIFSANDVIANVGVILGGLLVLWWQTRWPDIVIGIIIVAVILRGARLILLDAKAELDSASQENQPLHSARKET